VRLRPLNKHLLTLLSQLVVIRSMPRPVNLLASVFTSTLTRAALVALHALLNTRATTAKACFILSSVVLS